MKYYTVKDLLKELKAMDQDRIVVLQRDPEGNGYSPCKGADDNAAYNEREGGAGKQELLPIDLERGFDENDLACNNSIPCVILFPMY